MPEPLTREAALKTTALAATLRRHGISDHHGHDLRADPPAHAVRARTARASMKSGMDVLCTAAPFKISPKPRCIHTDRAAGPGDVGDIHDYSSDQIVPAGRATCSKGGPGKKRVLIIGGGFAGIAAARALKRADVEITLIDRRNHHIFQPLLYQVATAVLSPSEIAAPIRQLEAKQKNLSVLLAEVKGINLGARTVEAICPGIGSRKLEYDFLVIATGMRPSYFGHDEFARFAPGLKSLNDAETIRTKILSAFELAEVDR